MMRGFTAVWLAFTCTGAARADTHALPNAAFPAGFGVNIHFTHGGPGEVTQLAKAYRAARMDFAWSATEREKGVYDWSAYDGLTRELEAAGVTPYYILDYGNDLYQPGPPRTVEARAAYAHWAAAAVRHFKGHKILWEFWNEPNGNGFWGGRANADEYADLVNGAGPAIRKADPKATLLLGAVAGFDWTWMERVMRRGSLRWADAFSVHPYRSGYPESVTGDYARLRRMLHPYAQERDIPVVNGEWGYSTHANGGVDEETQARYLVRQRLINASQGIGTSIWYDWKEDGPDPNENEHHFGSVRPDRIVKPAYTAAKVMTETLAGYHVVRMLVNGPEKYEMLLRNDAGASALAIWTTGRSVNVPLPSTPQRVVGMMGEDRPRSLPVSAGPAPVYALFGKSDDLDDWAAWTWLPAGSVVTAGQPVRTTFRMHNTGTQARTYRFTLGVEGGDVVPNHISYTLNPGRSRAFPVTLSAWKRTPEGTATVELDSPDGKGTARTWGRQRFIIANPLSLSARLGGTGMMEVSVAATGVDGAHPLPIALHLNEAGQSVGRGVVWKITSPNAPRNTLRLPLPSAARAYGLRATDLHGHLLAELPPVRFETAFDFNLSTAGLAMHPEGDGKAGGAGQLTFPTVPKRGRVGDIAADFPEGWRYFVVTTQETAIPTGATTVGMWVNGDGGGDFLRCRVVDAKGQTFQPSVLIDFKGWKWVTMPLDDPTVGSWGGPQDGMMHQPLKWDAIALLDSGSQKTHHAHVQFADITLTLPDTSPALSAGERAAWDAIQARYAEREAAARSKNLARYMAQFAPDFQVIVLGSAPISRAKIRAFEAERLGLMSSFEGSAFHLYRFSFRGSQAVATVDGISKFTLRGPKGEPLHVVMTAVHRDTWKRTASGWMIERMEMQSGSATVNGKPAASLALQKSRLGSSAERKIFTLPRPA